MHHRNRFKENQRTPNYDRNDGLPGVVYILHNEAMRDGLYKIGQSTRSGAQRARDLNYTVGTETPKMFKCIFEERTADCGRAEKAVHERLAAHRLTRQEYFEVELELAKAIILEECAKQVPAPKVHQVSGTNNRAESSEKRREEVRINKLIFQRKNDWKLQMTKEKKTLGMLQGLLVGLACFGAVSGWLWISDKHHRVVWWLTAIVFIGVYIYNLDKPAKRFLDGQEARNELEKIEINIRFSSGAHSNVLGCPTITEGNREDALFVNGLTPSQELAEIVGPGPLPRTEVVSRIWDYIKAHKLQDATNRRAINADEKLKKIFGKEQVTMFEMATIIGKNLK